MEATLVNKRTGQETHVVATWSKVFSPKDCGPEYVWMNKDNHRDVFRVYVGREYLNKHYTIKDIDDEDEYKKCIFGAINQQLVDKIISENKKVYYATYHGRYYVMPKKELCYFAHDLIPLYKKYFSKAIRENNTFDKKKFSLLPDRTLYGFCLNGHIAQIDKGTATNRIYDLKSSCDRTSICTWIRKCTIDEAIIAVVAGGFLGALFSGWLFGILLATFGVVSMLFSGIVLGRDLEKDYSY